MRAVYDTNVFISGLFWHGPPRAVLEMAIKRDVDLVVSEHILSEISSTLRDSFNIADAETERILERILEISTLVYPSRKVRAVRDKKDNRILECALEGGCDYIVTGDKDLLVLKKYEGINILTPREFLE